MFVEIKIHNKELIARDKYNNVFVMKATGEFILINVIDLFWKIKDDRK